jgi:hypothetical protein
VHRKFFETFEHLAATVSIGTRTKVRSASHFTSVCPVPIATAPRSAAHPAVDTARASFRSAMGCARDRRGACRTRAFIHTIDAQFQVPMSIEVPHGTARTTRAHQDRRSGNTDL